MNPELPWVIIDNDQTNIPLEVYSTTFSEVQNFEIPCELEENELEDQFLMNQQLTYNQTVSSIFNLAYEMEEYQDERYSYCALTYTLSKSILMISPRFAAPSQYFQSHSIYQKCEEFVRSLSDPQFKKLIIYELIIQKKTPIISNEGNQEIIQQTDIYRERIINLSTKAGQRKRNLLLSLATFVAKIKAGSNRKLPDF